MKICFEGPSGIGKTSLAAYLKDDFTVIPEVNVLFKEEINEGGFWYFKKQIERYQMSLRSGKVIFDGDIFQPLWYNWSYGYPEGYFSLEKMHPYYSKIIREGKFSFPDIYFIFYASESVLRQRKEKDKTRRRKNFEKHLKLLETQRKYFGFMQECFPDLVVFMEFNTVESTAKKVGNHLGIKGSNGQNSEHVLNTMVDWLSGNNP